MSERRERREGEKEQGGEGGRSHCWNFDNLCLDNFVSDSNSNSDQLVSIAAEMSILQNKRICWNYDNICFTNVVSDLNSNSDRQVGLS